MRWQMPWVGGGVSWRLRVMVGRCGDALLQRHGTECEPAAEGVRQRTELATQRMRGMLARLLNSCACDAPAQYLAYI
ncbi:hypothetical protein [Xanthomonas arboricola]|uniref:hypothetical protein n=1 Tax=Xanthomonas arboricola TaxID=56448 RepID=UPI00138EE142|nr:hypothetical protein [Xanthomonas arboricola]MDN0223984.1 hypothetical protein [Xanthomonas arboricola pv. juglandis]MDN0228245.1 hypothetical protein [Xanthomonas arboricola pv. juglandis]MDN0232384.1 hypothetical protein [Xanthomonas arboricola pv. juglandis]MDN0236820.1 hypothetical protein [Xanthomonas arboricola pv. juglandis]MDN0249140.1 hypothetical protein [Xanthomonas arboricola pv. juglandis]